MITLNVEELCHNCPSFDAEQRSDVFNTDAEPHFEYEIVCSRRLECRNIRQFMEKTLGPAEKKKASDA